METQQSEVVKEEILLLRQSLTTTENSPTPSAAPSPSETKLVKSKSKRTLNDETPKLRCVIVSKTCEKNFEEFTVDKLLALDSEEIHRKNEKIWVDIADPTKEEMEAIGDKFNLHPLTVEEIVNPDSRPKVELFDERGYAFVAIKELRYKTGSNELMVDNMNVILSSQWLLSFHSSELRSISNVLHKLIHMSKDSNEYDKFMHTSDWALYAILQAISELSLRHTEAMDMEGEALDELVLIYKSADKGDILRRVAHARKSLHFLRTFIDSEGELLHMLSVKDLRLITHDTKIYLRDVLDSFIRMQDQLRVTKHTLHNLHTTYLAILGIESAKTANQVNLVMRKFSAIATVFLPLSFLSALWGMNVRVPGSYLQTSSPVGENENYGSFIAIVSAMVLFILILAFLFRTKKVI